MAIYPRLLVGLGNPTDQYTRTRHNIGRRFIDSVAAETKSKFDSIRQAETFRLPDFFSLPLEEPLYFCRLTCFMNNSGPALKSILEKANIAPAECLVLVDDFMIPFGSLRLRTQGSSGGHNGLKSIFETFGSEEIPRLRVGIGPTPEGQDPADFVLKNFSKSEESKMADLFQAIKDSLTHLFKNGYEKAMNETNKIHF